MVIPGWLVKAGKNAMSDPGEKKDTCCLRKQSDLLCFGSIRTAEMHFSFFKTPCLCGFQHQKTIRQKVVHLSDWVLQHRHRNTVYAAAKTTAVNYTLSENPNNHWQTGQHRIFSLSSQDSACNYTYRYCPIFQW